MLSLVQLSGSERACVCGTFRYEALSKQDTDKDRTTKIHSINLINICSPINNLQSVWQFFKQTFVRRTFCPFTKMWQSDWTSCSDGRLSRRWWWWSWWCTTQCTSVNANRFIARHRRRPRVFIWAQIGDIHVRFRSYGSVMDTFVFISNADCKFA